jgi:hypothetical protein
MTAMRRRSTRILALASISFSLFGVGVASAETYTVKTGGETSEFLADVAKCNAATSACTIILPSGVYLPSKSIVFTNTAAATTIEGPVGTPTTSTLPAEISGGSLEAVSELLIVEPQVTVKLKNLEIAKGGGENYPAIEIEGENSKTKTPGGNVTVEGATLDNVGTNLAVQPGATLTVNNSTISDGREYGLLNLGKTSIYNSTIAYNREVGIENAGEETKLTNTIVAENKEHDCEGPVTSSVKSLDSDGSCGVSLSKTNPLLQKELLNNGGSTPVHSVKAGSPAINAGEKSACLATDQRGAPRPGISGDSCTIGADEYNNAAPKLTLPANITKETASSEGTAVEYTVTAVGVGDRVQKLTCAPASGSTFPIGTTTVKCTATDGHENKATGEFTVTVKAKKEENLKEGHPELFVNNLKAEGESKAVTQVGYGQIELESKQLEGGEIECVNLGFGTGYNAGSPLRSQGKILAWSSAGHVASTKAKEPAKENTTRSACKGLGGAAYVTDEKALKSGVRSALTTPWNVEVECGERGEEQTSIIKIGAPTTQTSAEKSANEKRGCENEEEEVEQEANEVTNKEGCYKSVPAPAGCIGVDVIVPAIGLEVTYGGTQRAKGKNGSGNGLNQSTWVFEGAASGELVCQTTGCEAKGVTYGEVKEQGFAGVQLVVNK